MSDLRRTGQPRTFDALTPSQKRMVAAGKVGRFCDLLVRGAERRSVVVSALATPAQNYPDKLRSMLVVEDYYTGDMLVVPLVEIQRLEEREWPVSDHRHPDWEPPGRVVRPAKR